MNERVIEGSEPRVDVGEYCRAVEAHLTRVNAGDIVRLVGPAFELVRGWALEGIPLSLVFHGITAKAERHRAGTAKRPLRLEFCEGDVRETYDHWRRAVGLARVAVTMPDATGSTQATDTTSRQPSLAKHLDRVIDRLGRAAGRLDFPDALRGAITEVLDTATTIRERVKAVRGPARAEFASELPELDTRLIGAVRANAARDELRQIELDTAADLAAYRTRLSPEAWERSITLGVDTLLRDRYGLPEVAFDP